MYRIAKLLDYLAHWLWELSARLMGDDPDSDQASVKFISLDDMEDYDEMSIPRFCFLCGGRLQVVRPGKWQCPRCE